MNKGIVLYLLAFGLASLSVWQPTVLGWLLPVAVMGVLPVGALWLWRHGGRKFSELGFSRWAGKKAEFAKGALIGLIIPQLVTVLLFAMGMLILTSATWRVPLAAGVAGGILVGVIKTSIIVFIEEVVFRGFFIQYLGTDIKQSVTISSLLFGAAHIPMMINSGLEKPYLFVGVVTFFVLGVALGMSFVKTGNSLALPLGLHFGYNLGYSTFVFVVSAIIQQPRAVRYIGPDWLVGQSSWSPESGLIGILVTLAIVGVMAFTTNKMARKTAYPTLCVLKAIVN